MAQRSKAAAMLVGGRTVKQLPSGRSFSWLVRRLRDAVPTTGRLAFPFGSRGTCRFGLIAAIAVDLGRSESLSAIGCPFAWCHSLNCFQMNSVNGIPYLVNSVAVLCLNFVSGDVGFAPMDVWKARTKNVRLNRVRVIFYVSSYGANGEWGRVSSLARSLSALSRLPSFGEIG